MQIKVPLQRLISDESLPAHATLEFHRFVHFSYRVDIEPKKKGLLLLLRDLNAMRKWRKVLTL
jgi:hypothetical protein